MTTLEDGAGTPRSPKQRKLRPWWRWNLITLAVVLFVVLWVRELAGMRLADTYWMVLSIFLVWWLAPCLVLRRLPWPLSLFGYLTVGEPPNSPSRRRTERVCRALAVLLAMGGLCQLLMALGWIFQVRGNIGPRRFRDGDGGRREQPDRRDADLRDSGRPVDDRLDRLDRWAPG